MNVYRWAAFAVSLHLLSNASLAHAQERDPVRADALFRQGIDLLKRDDWLTACPLFDESMRLDASVGAAINIARCQERAGKTLTAWREFKRASELNRNANSEVINAASDEFINAALARLEPRIPRIALHAPNAPRDLHVEIHGQKVSDLSQELQLDPGSYPLVATASGYQKLELTVEASDGSTTDVQIALQPEPKPALVEPPPAVTPASPPASARDAGMNGQALTGLVIGGVGGVAILASAVTGGLALGASNDLEDLNCTELPGERLACDPGAIDTAKKTKSRGETLALTSTITLFSGLALLGGGLAVFFTAPVSQEVSIAPLLGQGFAGVSVGGAL
jgi:hypothetical protein